MTNSPKGRDEPKQIDSCSSTHGSIPGPDSADRTNWLRSDEAENVRGTAPVSVVIPCYKCAGTIDRAVNSVVGQSWFPAELILVDDGNAEDTLSALRMQERRLGSSFVHIIRLPRNQGAAAARNAGWDAATQPYVAFLDADDAWHPRKLELQMGFVFEHSDVGVCAHGLRWVVGNIPAFDVVHTIRARGIKKRELLLHNPIVTSSVIITRSLPQRFDSAKRRSEDYGLWLEAVCSGVGIALLDAQLAYSFKAPFGAGGLSGALWQMEQGELDNYLALRKSGRITLMTWVAASAYSLVRHLRRLLIVWLRRLRWCARS